MPEDTPMEVPGWPAGITRGDLEAIQYGVKPLSVDFAPGDTRLLTIEECIERLKWRAMDSKDPLDPNTVSSRVLRAILGLPPFEETDHA
jgi:hypothetical protein